MYFLFLRYFCGFKIRFSTLATNLNLEKKYFMPFHTQSYWFGIFSALFYYKNNVINMCSYVYTIHVIGTLYSYIWFSNLLLHYYGRCWRNACCSKKSAFISLSVHQGIYILCTSYANGLVYRWKKKNENLQTRPKRNNIYWKW